MVYMSNRISTHSLPMRYADFSTPVEALDYAALGNAGMNFYDRRIQPEAVLEYRELKMRAKAGARRLLSLNLNKGDRVALIAETSVGFVEAFLRVSMRGWWRYRWPFLWGLDNAILIPRNCRACSPVVSLRLSSAVTNGCR